MDLKKWDCPLCGFENVFYKEIEKDERFFREHCCECEGVFELKIEKKYVISSVDVWRF